MRPLLFPQLTSLWHFRIHHVKTTPISHRCPKVHLLSHPVSLKLDVIAMFSPSRPANHHCLLLASLEMQCSAPTPPSTNSLIHFWIPFTILGPKLVLSSSPTSLYLHIDAISSDCCTAFFAHDGNTRPFSLSRPISIVVWNNSIYWSW